MIKLGIIIIIILNLDAGIRENKNELTMIVGIEYKNNVMKMAGDHKHDKQIEKINK